MKCEEIRPSIIVAASDHVTGTIAAVASKILGVPFIYEMRGLWAYTRATNNPGYDRSFDYAMRLRIEKQCAMEADRVVVISEGLKGVVLNWGISEKKILILPNGVENPKRAPNHFDAKEGTVKLGYIGSILPYEGLRTTIEAMKIMKEEGKVSVKLTIAGEGSGKEELEKIAHDYDLSERVEFRGRIPHQDIDQFYGEIDAIILPRLSTLVTDIIPPLKPLEAIYKEKIVISSRINTHNELFENISGSIQFEPDDVISQIGAIERFVDLTGQHEVMINDALNYVQNNRNYRHMTRAIAKEILLLELQSLENGEYELDDISNAIPVIITSGETIDSDRGLNLSSEEIISLIRRFGGKFKGDLYLTIIRVLVKDRPELCLEIANELQLEVNDERALMTLTRAANRAGMYGVANILHVTNNRILQSEIDDELNQFWKFKKIKNLKNRKEILSLERELENGKMSNQISSSEEEVILLIRALKKNLLEGESNLNSDSIIEIINKFDHVKDQGYRLFLDWILLYLQNHAIGSEVMQRLLVGGRHDLGAMIYNPEQEYHLKDDDRKVLLDSVLKNNRNKERIKHMKNEYNRMVKKFREGERGSSSDEIIRLGGRLIANNSMSLTPLIHMTNAHIHKGNLSTATKLLTDSRWRDHVRVIPKIANYESQLSWLSSGFDISSSLENLQYKPIKGRVVYTLHNSLPYNSGGYATRSHGIAVGLRNLGWDVHVVTRLGYPHDRKGIDTSNFKNLEDIDGVTYHRLYSEDAGFGRTILTDYLEQYKMELDILPYLISKLG